MNSSTDKMTTTGDKNPGGKPAVVTSSTSKDGVGGGGGTASQDSITSSRGRCGASLSASESPVIKFQHALVLATGGPRDVRRGSFIYKTDLKPEHYSSRSSFSRTFSISSSDNTGLHKSSDAVKNLVTPFAKILTNLHCVRLSLSKILQISGSESAGSSQKEDSSTDKDKLNEIYELVSDTMHDFDKCLEEVEAIPIQQSLSDMTKLKFKKLLAQELNHLAASKSGNQVSRYIADTFTENDYTADESGPSADGFAFRRTLGSVGETSLARTGATAGSGSPAPSIKSNGRMTAGGIVSGLFGGGAGKKFSPSSPPSTSSSSLSSGGLNAKLSKIYAFKKPRHLRVKLPPALKRSSAHSLTMLGDVSDRSTAKSKSPSADDYFGVNTDKKRELVECMHDIDTWGLDVFTLSSLTKNRPLTAVFYTLLKQRNLIKHFQLNEQTLLKYCHHLERNYNNTNPYHNVTHAADVTQSMHFLLMTNALQNIFNELEIFAALFASAIHDVNHPGVTNQFLINTGSELAIMYNDESVLEHHHLAIAFKLLQQPSCNLLADFSKKQFAAFRRCVIDMVLATDMAKHMSLLAYLKTLVETKNVTSEGFLPFESPKEKIELLKCMIHLSDLSNPTKPLRLYQQWTERISEEFWKQGDQERRLGLEISPLCDRRNASMEKSQVGFIDFVALPLWECWAELIYPSAQFILDNLERNRRWYSERIPVEEEAGEEVESK